MNAKQALAFSAALAAAAAAFAFFVIGFVIAGVPGVALYIIILGTPILLCGLEMLRRTG